MTQLLLTALGPDRPGLVGDLTRHLFDAGANLVETRMVNLRGRFVVVLLLEVGADRTAKLTANAEAFGASIGLTVQIEPLEEAAAAIEGLPYRLRTYSLDQPGIVARLSDLLRRHGVNVEELSADQQSAPFAGHPLFVTDFRLTVPARVNLSRLRTELESLAGQLNCDLDFEPVR